MQWLISIFVALLCGALSLILAGSIANACVAWFHISNREGKSGFFVVFMALLGGLAGCVVGLIAARTTVALWSPAFLAQLLTGSLSVILLAAIIAALCRGLADVPPTSDGQPLVVEVEFRFPTGMDLTEAEKSADDWAVELSSIAGQTRRAYETGEIRWTDARRDDDRLIVPTVVPLFTERGQKAISLRQGEKDLAGFLLSIPRWPDKSYEAWSPWLPHQQPDGRPWPEDKFSYRFRIHP